MRCTTFKVILATICFTFSAHTFAFPALGLIETTPNIDSQSITVNYVGNNSSGILTASGIALTFTPGGNIAGGSFDINATINFNAQTAIGSLVIGGTIAGLGFSSGTLLTGTFSSTTEDPAFGSGSNDPLEFLFTVTGGDAASLYGGVGSLVAVILSTSGFSGSFASNFNSGPSEGNADTFIKLTLPPPPPPPPPPKPQISIDGGFIKLDTTDGGAPLAAYCSKTSHNGRMVFDDVNDRLYICTATGWIFK